MYSQIDGVLTFPIPSFLDDRGEVIKIPVPPFVVKDVYVTTIRKDAIKAWHGYNTKSLYWTVVRGIVQLGLYDDRVDSITYGVNDTLFLGQGAYFSVLVPPGIYNGFKGISNEDAVIVVQADEYYGQINRKSYDIGEFNYDWDVRHG